MSRPVCHSQYIKWINIPIGLVKNRSKIGQSWFELVKLCSGTFSFTLYILYIFTYFGISTSPDVFINTYFCYYLNFSLISMFINKFVVYVIFSLLSYFNLLTILRLKDIRQLT